MPETNLAHKQSIKAPARNANRLQGHHQRPQAIWRRRLAGLFVRGSAFLLDLIIIATLLLPARYILKRFLDISILSSPRQILLLIKTGEISIASAIAAQGDAIIVMAGIAFFYFAICEGSSIKTTPGKQFLLLKVSRHNYQPAGYVRATLRAFTKILPVFPLLAVAFYGTFVWAKAIPGYSVVLEENDMVMTAVLFLSTIIFTAIANLMALFSTKNLALHDIIAGTIVTQHQAFTLGASVLRIAFALSIIAVATWAISF